MERDESVSLDQWTPGVPISEEPFFAVVTIDEQKVHWLVVTGCIDTAPPDPDDRGVWRALDFSPRDQPLHAEPEPSSRKRIDRRQHAARVHHGAKAFRRDAVPDADLHDAAPAPGMTGETVSFRCRRLSLWGSEADGPRREMCDDSHGRLGPIDENGAGKRHGRTESRSDRRLICCRLTASYA